MSNEKVLVVPRSVLNDLGHFEGFSTDMRYEVLTKHHPNSFFMDRADAEIDPNFKQLIPYVLFARFMPCEGYNELELLSYYRGKSGGEARLHDKMAIGLGGHVNEGDRTYHGGLMREIGSEELQIPDFELAEAPIIGFVNQEHSTVAQVHFGVVHLVVGRDDVDLGTEASQHELAWRPFIQLAGCNKLEGWSELLLNCPLLAAIGKMDL